jgi:hypothetical protein
MLYFKKIGKLKTSIYAGLIGLMLFGTLYFVYKNYQIINGKSYSANSIRLQTTSSELNQKVAGKNLDSLKTNLEDLKIFNNNIFKNLKINTEQSMGVKAGNEDPFKPYE